MLRFNKALLLPLTPKKRSFNRIDMENGAYRVNKKSNNGTPAKLKALIEHLYSLKDGKFTGYIKVNYSQGAIARIEKFEEILRKRE